MVIVTEEQVRYMQANHSKINTDSNYTHVNNIKMTKLLFFLWDLVTINIDYYDYILNKWPF
jgi:hypothetical protein